MDHKASAQLLAQVIPLMERESWDGRRQEIGFDNPADGTQRFWYWWMKIPGGLRVRTVLVDGQRTVSDEFDVALSPPASKSALIAAVRLAVSRLYDGPQSALEPQVVTQPKVALCRLCSHARTVGELCDGHAAREEMYRRGRELTYEFPLASLAEYQELLALRPPVGEPAKIYASFRVGETLKSEASAMTLKLSSYARVHGEPIRCATPNCPRPHRLDRPGLHESYRPWCMECIDEAIDAAETWAYGPIVAKRREMDEALRDPWRKVTTVPMVPMDQVQGLSPMVTLKPEPKWVEGTQVIGWATGAPDVSGTGLFGVSVSFVRGYGGDGEEESMPAGIKLASVMLAVGNLNLRTRALKRVALNEAGDTVVAIEGL